MQSAVLWSPLYLGTIMSEIFEKLTAFFWWHHTFNPWWGCVKIANQEFGSGCDHCYAESYAKLRSSENVWGPHAPRRFLSDAHWKQPLRWNKAAQAAGVRRNVFCASMGDVFECRADLVIHRARLLELIDVTPHLNWLIPTKRPQNIKKLLPESYANARNLWIGTTVEHQHAADTRIPYLLDCNRVAFRFLSCEPLLGPVDIRQYLRPNKNGANIDWVIVGGESGGHSRPMNPIWAVSLIRQCEETGVPVFFKQWGDYLPTKFVEINGRKRKVIPVFKSNGDPISMTRVGTKNAGYEILGQTYKQFPKRKPR
jgi:protein gp37